MLREFFVKLKKGTEYLNYGHHIVSAWGVQEYGARLARLKSAGGGDAEFRILDLGCGMGEDLSTIKREAVLEPALDLKLFGFEANQGFIDFCRKDGIETFDLNLERDRFPGEDASYDIIIANQILEHTKEVFWIIAEATRLLKPGGKLIVGVPNLASLHNRLLLLFGRQPTAQQTYSAHVRAFTKPDFRKFIELGGFYELLDFKGSNFYPFGKTLAVPLSKLLPTMAWGNFYLMQRGTREGSFLECLEGDGNLLETPFYGSPQNPAG